MQSERECEACGGSFRARNGQHRFCSSACRLRSHRGATVTALEGEDAPDESLESVTRRQLESVGREATPAGVNAVLLARKLDRGGDTGSAMAALSRQHLAALEDATRGVAMDDDPVDELRERRRQRQLDVG